MRQKYIAISLLACVLTACSHNDENIVVNDGPVAAQITAGTDDAIGVTVTAAPTSNMETVYRNVEYTISTGGSTQSATFTSATGIYFQDENETVTFSAYFPYQSELAENG